MSLSHLPLSYCTNLHPGQTIAEVRHGLSQYTVPTRERFGALAAGLWLARPVVTELLQTPESLTELRDDLRRAKLSCYTLNTFPFGNFHQARVKENVYLPDWSTDARVEFTCDSARVLAALMDDDITDGSMSTVPLGFKDLVPSTVSKTPAENCLLGSNIGREAFLDRCAEQLVVVAKFLAQLHEATGKRIRLAIEPEPFCVLETTPEAVDFFHRLFAFADRSGARTEVNEYIGLCYDVCHQSVEFEDVTASIRQLEAAEIRINKVHITCAIRMENAATNLAGREALSGYAEPRYLHQTIGQLASGQLVRELDLTRELALEPPADFAAAQEWRIHFHVPVNAEQLGPLKTTRDDLRLALAAVKNLNYAPHLEVETYTWGVLPDGRRVDLVDGLTAELQATATLLSGLTDS